MVFITEPPTYTLSKRPGPADPATPRTGALSPRVEAMLASMNAGVAAELIPLLTSAGPSAPTKLRKESLQTPRSAAGSRGPPAYTTGISRGGAMERPCTAPAYEQASRRYNWHVQAGVAAGVPSGSVPPGVSPGVPSAVQGMILPSLHVLHVAEQQRQDRAEPWSPPTSKPRTPPSPRHKPPRALLPFFEAPRLSREAARETADGRAAAVATLWERRHQARVAATERRLVEMRGPHRR